MFVAVKLALPIVPACLYSLPFRSLRFHFIFAGRPYIRQSIFTAEATGQITRCCIVS